METWRDMHAVKTTTRVARRFDVARDLCFRNGRAIGFRVLFTWYDGFVA